MTEKEWKEFRDAVYYSNIDSPIAGKIMVALDRYFTVLKSFEEESFEGSKIFLISQGVNIDECIEKGLKVISDLKIKINKSNAIIQPKSNKASK